VLSAALHLQEVAAARVIAAEGVLLVAGASSNSLAQLLQTPELQCLIGLADSNQVGPVQLQQKWQGAQNSGIVTLCSTACCGTSHANCTTTTTTTTVPRMASTRADAVAVARKHC
jgi:hypothetical protein